MHRTVVPISMIPAAITMITDIKMESAQDLFIKNEVMNLDRTSFTVGKSLAGAGWQAIGSSPHEALSHVLKVVFALLKEKLRRLELWLLAGTSAWQPNTRVVRHYKLWGGLRVRGLEIPPDSQSMEVLIESGIGVKFFGAAKLSDFDAVDIIVKILLEEHCTYLAALPSDLSPSALLNIGWSGDLRSDSKIINYIAESDGLLLKQTGEFDAYERGIVSIGHPSIVKALI